MKQRPLLHHQRSFSVVNPHQLSWSSSQANHQSHFSSVEGQLTSSSLFEEGSFCRKEDVTELIRELVPPPPPDISQDTILSTIANCQEVNESDEDTTEEIEGHFQLFHRRPTEPDLLEKLKLLSCPEETVKNLDDYIIHFIEQGRCASWRDVVETVLQSMEKHHRNPQVQLKAFECFHHVFEHRKDHVKWFYKCLNQVSKAMKAFRTFECIQRSGVKLLQRDGVLAEYRNKLDIACLVLSALCDLPEVSDFIVFSKEIVSLLSAADKLKVKGYEKFVSMLVEFPRRPYCLVPSSWAALEILLLLAKCGKEWDVFHKVGGQEKLAELSLRPELKDRCEAVLASLSRVKEHNYQPAVTGTVDHPAVSHTTQHSVSNFQDKGETQTSMPSTKIPGAVFQHNSVPQQLKQYGLCHKKAFNSYAIKETSQLPKKSHVSSAPRRGRRRNRKPYKPPFRLKKNDVVMNRRDHKHCDDTAPLDAVLTLRPATPTHRTVQDDVSDSELQFSDDELPPHSDPQICTSPAEESPPTTTSSPHSTSHTPSYSPSYSPRYSPLLSVQTTPCEIGNYLGQQCRDVYEENQSEAEKLTQFDKNSLVLKDQSVFLPSPFVSSKSETSHPRQCTGKEKTVEQEIHPIVEERNPKKSIPLLSLVEKRIFPQEKLNELVPSAEINISFKDKTEFVFQEGEMQCDGGMKKSNTSQYVKGPVRHDVYESKFGLFNDRSPGINSNILSSQLCPSKCKAKQKCSDANCNKVAAFSAEGMVEPCIDSEMVRKSNNIYHLFEQEHNSWKESVQVSPVCVSVSRESYVSPAQLRSVLTDVSNNSEMDCNSEQKFRLGPVTIPAKIKIPLNLKGAKPALNLKREIPMKNESGSEKRIKIEEMDYCVGKKHNEVGGTTAFPISNMHSKLPVIKRDPHTIPHDSANINSNSASSSFLKVEKKNLETLDHFDSAFNSNSASSSFLKVEKKNLETLDHFDSALLPVGEACDSNEGASAFESPPLKYVKSPGICVIKESPSRKCLQKEREDCHLSQEKKSSVYWNKTTCWICDQPSIANELKQVQPYLLQHGCSVLRRINENLCDQHVSACSEQDLKMESPSSQSLSDSGR